MNICSSAVLLTLLIDGAYAQSSPPPYLLTTWAGSASIGDGSAAARALLIQPASAASDSAGNIYIADTGNNRIRKVTRDGIITTIAGTGQAVNDGDGGPAVAAGVQSPKKLAIDRTGNIYVAAWNSLRRISPDGVIKTMLTIPATAAYCHGLESLALDPTGSLYILASWQVQKVASDGSLVRIAGNLPVTCVEDSAGDGRPALGAMMPYPNDMAFDADGNLYISELFRVRKVSGAGTITTVFDGSADFQMPFGVAVNSAKEAYFGEMTCHCIKRISGSSTKVVIGSGIAGNTGDGGQAVAAQIGSPGLLSFDAAGNLLIPDSSNQNIRKVAPTGIISTIAGADHATSLFSSPAEMVMDTAGNLYFSDASDHRVRRISVKGEVTVVAGTGVRGFSGDGHSAINAQLNNPHGLAIESTGNLYIADSYNCRIRKVATDATISTIAGNGLCFGGHPIDGKATQTALSYPDAVALDRVGNLYITSDGLASSYVVRVAPNGFLSTFAGDGTFTTDNSVPMAALASDPLGMLYAAYTTIVRVTGFGPPFPISGLGENEADGIAAINAHLGIVGGMTFDRQGGLFLTVRPDWTISPDQSSLVPLPGGHKVRMITAAGVIYTLAGTGSPGSQGTGGLASTAQLSSPAGIAISSSGTIYVADAGNHRIVQLTPATGIRFQIAGGDQQAAQVGSALPNPLVVQLLGATGAGIPATTVNFTVATGSATLSAPSVMTSTDGKASISAKVGTQPGAVTVMASVQGLAPLIFRLTATPIPPPAPAVASGGIQGYALTIPPVTQFAPLGLVSLTGSNFAATGTDLSVTPADTANGVLPQKLADTCVRVGDSFAALLRVTPVRIDLQIPGTAALGENTLTVIVNCETPEAVAGRPERITIVPAAPELLYASHNPDGHNPVLARNATTGTAISLDVPARPGDTISLYGVGFGLTDPPLATGQISARPVDLAAPVAVQINGVQLADHQLGYSGAEPGQAGVYRIDVTLPDDMPDGDLSIALRIEDTQTPPGAYLTVKASTPTSDDSARLRRLRRQ